MKISHKLRYLILFFLLPCILCCRQIDTFYGAIEVEEPVLLELMVFLKPTKGQALGISEELSTSYYEKFRSHFFSIVPNFSSPDCIKISYKFGQKVMLGNMLSWMKSDESDQLGWKESDKSCRYFLGVLKVKKIKLPKFITIEIFLMSEFLRYKPSY